MKPINERPGPKPTADDLRAAVDAIHAWPGSPPEMFAVGVGAKAPDGSDLAPGLYRNGPDGVECIEDWTETDGDGVPSLHGIMARLESVREIATMHEAEIVVRKNRSVGYTKTDPDDILADIVDPEVRKRIAARLEAGAERALTDVLTGGRGFEPETTYGRPHGESVVARTLRELGALTNLEGGPPLESGLSPATQARLVDVYRGRMARRWPWYRRAWAAVRRFWPAFLAAMCKQADGPDETNGGR